MAYTLVSSVFAYYFMAILPRKNKALKDLQSPIDRNFTANKNYTRFNQRNLPLKMGGVGVLASTTYWIKQLLNYYALKEHLRPQALKIPIHVLEKWVLNMRYIFNSTEVE